MVVRAKNEPRDSHIVAAPVDDQRAIDGFEQIDTRSTASDRQDRHAGMAERLTEEPQGRFVVQRTTTEEVVDTVFGQREAIAPEAQRSAASGRINERDGDRIRCLLDGHPRCVRRNGRPRPLPSRRAGNAFRTRHRCKDVCQRRRLTCLGRKRCRSLVAVRALEIRTAFRRRCRLY